MVQLNKTAHINAKLQEIRPFLYRVEIIFGFNFQYRFFKNAKELIWKINPQKFLKIFWAFLGWLNRTFELFQSTKKTLFWPNILRRRQNLEKTGQEGVLRYFLETFDRKIKFFGAHSPLKIGIFRRLGAFRKVLGSVYQKWISN